MSKAQKEIIYATLIAVGFLLVFWFLILAPVSKRLGSIKQKLRDAESQIAAINLLTQGKDLSVAVKELNSQSARVLERFPGREEEVVRSLSEEAGKRKIEIKNISFAQKRPAQAKAAGYSIEELPVVMRLSGEYRSIGEYLRAIQGPSGVFARLQQLDIRGRGEGQMVLDVTLRLAAYLARKQKP